MKSWHFAVAAGAFTLSACSGSTVKDTLGLTRSAPDEYRVVSRPPLSVPPQFGLRPPSATELSPGQVPASDQAESLLLGGGSAHGSLNADTAVLPVTRSNAGSPVKGAQKGPAKDMGAADSQFLQNAGAASANPRVREELVEERYTRMEQKESAPWWDVLDWTSDKEPMVDAKKEAQRIQQNEDEGKPVTEGSTPEIKGRDTGILGKIFDY
jgi:hypothetical protein